MTIMMWNKRVIYLIGNIKIIIHKVVNRFQEIATKIINSIKSIIVIKQVIINRNNNEYNIKGIIERRRELREEMREKVLELNKDINNRDKQIRPGIIRDPVNRYE